MKANRKLKTAITVDRYGSFEIWVRSPQRTVWWLTVTCKEVAIRECALFQRMFLEAKAR